MTANMCTYAHMHGIFGFTIWTHTHTTHTHTHIQTKYMHACTHAYMHTCIHPYMHTSIHRYIHTSIYPSIHTYTYMHIHIYIYISFHLNAYSPQTHALAYFLFTYTQFITCLICAVDFGALIYRWHRRAHHGRSAGLVAPNAVFMRQRFIDPIETCFLHTCA